MCSGSHKVQPEMCFRFMPSISQRNDCSWWKRFSKHLLGPDKTPDHPQAMNGMLAKAQKRLKAWKNGNPRNPAAWCLVSKKMGKASDDGEVSANLKISQVQATCQCLDCSPEPIRFDQPQSRLTNKFKAFWTSNFIYWIILLCHLF